MKDLDFGSSAQKSVPIFIAKSIAFVIFYIALAFCCPLGRFCVPPAVAATTRASKIPEWKVRLYKKERSGHKYSHFTSTLLDSVSELLQKIEEVKSGKNDVGCVKEALKNVKMLKTELQYELMNCLHEELRVPRENKRELKIYFKKLMDDFEKETSRMREWEKRGVTGEEVNEKKVDLRNIERKCNAVWEKIGEIEDDIYRRETMALSIGGRELSFVERECEQLVKAFLREMRQPGR